MKRISQYKMVIVSLTLILFSVIAGVVSYSGEVYALERAMYGPTTQQIKTGEYFGILATLKIENQYYFEFNGTKAVDLLVMTTENFEKYNTSITYNNDTSFQYLPNLSVFNKTTGNSTINVDNALRNTVLGTDNPDADTIQLYFIIDNSNVTTTGAMSTGDVNVTMALYLDINNAPGFTAPIMIISLVSFAAIVYRRRKNKNKM